MITNVGMFEINTWEGGYPVWVEVSFCGDVVMKFTHREIADLEYAVKKAKQNAISILPERYKEEV